MKFQNGRKIDFIDFWLP